MLPILSKGVDGIEFKRAAVKTASASVAASALQVLGMLQWEGGNWTVLDIPSDAVLLI